MDDIREIFLKREEETLSPYACLTRNSRGRQKSCEPCDTRTDFQRDRDRIIHSKSFRRLMHKTQVFLSPQDEHYRTRMTHTLEVTQIARIIARALRLNEDLTEAIAMGHDLGHTPFGHAGEVAMRRCFDPHFAHYEQSLRVVDVLEQNGAGLNLTYEVRDGILRHTGEHMAETLEGVVVKFADRIAYINHDIDDAERADILKNEDIPENIRAVLGNSQSARINTMVRAVIEASADSPVISMTEEVGATTNALRDFLFERVYTHSIAKKEESKAQELLISLYEYFLAHLDKMPALYYRNIERDGKERCVCDYVAGMSDRYAVELYQNLFVPKVWRGPVS